MKILVAGGAGFVGSHVAEHYAKKKNEVIVFDNLCRAKLLNKDEKNSKYNWNYMEKNKNIKLVKGDIINYDEILQSSKNVDVIVHAAAQTAVTTSIVDPKQDFLTNALGTFNVLEAARKNNVERFLTVSSACVYSKECTIPTPEAEGFKDVPEQTNEGYGWAKRMEEFLSRAYAKEFGMRIAIVRPSNMYGPRDNFEPEKAHVIPNLLTKIMKGDGTLTVFGTGKPTRAFLYVEDFCDGAMAAVEHACDGDPINIGSDEEISIKALVELLCKHVGKAPMVIFDTTKPDGHMRRASDITKAKTKLQFKQKIFIEEGIKRTIAWYKEEMDNGDC